MKETNTDTSRRRFLRNAGILALGATLGGCVAGSGNDESSSTADTGAMTLRTNPNTGDKVSLLGFGCMRFPTLGMANGSDDDTLGQEAINRLVDMALEGGVNYFDTSPAYCKGQSEAAIGNALARHPRDSYFIATKLSNFSPAQWSHEAGVEMFQNSLQNLHTDYVDYLLLHAIGMGGMDALHGRYLDNGMLDYLVEQRKNGTIRNLGFSLSRRYRGIRLPARHDGPRRDSLGLCTDSTQLS